MRNIERILISEARIGGPAGPLADLLIRDGIIEEIGVRIDCEEAEQVHAAGLIAAPGLVDLHVHLRDPGFTDKEDVLSGCRAAAAGGVTSLVCMPNTSPALDTADAVRAVLEKAEHADARVYPAAAISMGLQSREATDLKALREAGAVAVSDDGRPVTDTALLARAMGQAESLSLRVLCHCEDLFLSAGGKLNEGSVSARLGVKGVPAAAEDCGTAREIALAAAYNVPVHICHVSTANSVAMLRDAKRRGVRVTAETAPHYFALTEKELLGRDADYRMSPPLRTERDRLAVIEGLQDGTIDAIATDHAPHTPAEKADFLTAPNGVIGMETSFSAGLTYLVKPGLLTLRKLLELMSENPARLLGLNAGRLEAGAPADLFLFDPEESWNVEPDRLHGKSRNAVFKGRKLTGRVKLTVCRGKIVYRDGAEA